MTRADKIKAGKIWQIYPDSDGDKILFEGSRSACLKWLRQNTSGLWYAYKRGEIRIGQLILETP